MENRQWLLCLVSLCFHYWAWMKDFLLLIFVIWVQVQTSFNTVKETRHALGCEKYHSWSQSMTEFFNPHNTSPFALMTNTSFIYSSAAAASFLQRLFQYLKELPCQHQALCTPTTLDLFNPIWIYFGPFFCNFQTLGQSLVLIQWGICQSKKLPLFRVWLEPIDKSKPKFE